MIFAFVLAIPMVKIIYPFLLFDTKINRINPVYPNCYDIDTINLKKKDIAFCRGAVDPASILYKTRFEDIRKNVSKRYEIFSKDENFLFAPKDNILSEIPS